MQHVCSRAAAECNDVTVAGCDALRDAFSARAEVVARANGQNLTVDRLADLAGNGKQVPLDTEARRVAGRFILTAVARENLGESYDLVHPELRQGMTRREWLTGNIPVVYYPAKAIETATFKVDESYPDEAILEVALLPKDSAKVKPQIFFIGLKKTGAHWRVSYWVPRAAPAVPNARD